MFGKLYLIATPIGNLGDITYRAVEILKKVDIIAAEDTRHSLKLLNYLDISKPMISYHRHNEDTKTETLINLLKDGKNIGLITDAGTPGISDPGEEVVKQAIKEKIEIIPIPGACALINALIASGLNTKEFAFYGFLPLDKKLRNEKMEDIQKQNKTIIFYEAPHRLEKTLAELLDRFGNIEIVIAKELTKIHESFIRGRIEDILPTLKDGTLLAAICIVSPVCGFRPSLAARSFTSNVPKPTSDTFSPLISASVTTVVKASTAFPASFLEIPAFSATAATKSTLFIFNTS